jgi:SAM-dependent methyltransferase
VQRLLPEDSHWWFASRTRALQAIAAPAIGSVAHGRRLRVLDIGCGAANMAHHLREWGDVVGFDPFLAPLRVAVNRGLPVVQADASRLPYASQAFDVVAALDVIEHCKDDSAVAAELHRVLRPSGVLVVSVPAFEFLWTYNDRVNRHYRRYSREQLGLVLAAAGLVVERASYTNFLIFPAVAPLLMARGDRPGRKLSAPTTDGDYQVEMEPTSPRVNTILEAVGIVEASLIGSVDLPFGTGLLCVARRPA